MGAPAERQPTLPHRAEGHADAPAPSSSGRCLAEGHCNTLKGCGAQGGCWRKGRELSAPPAAGMWVQEHPPSTQHRLLSLGDEGRHVQCWSQGRAHARRADHGQGSGRLQAPRSLKGAIVCPGL